MSSLSLSTDWANQARTGDSSVHWQNVFSDSMSLAELLGPCQKELRCLSSSDIFWACD